MQVGLIGAGNIATALARGWGDPVLCSDSGSGRARALAQELGGEALESNAQVAQRADLAGQRTRTVCDGIRTQQRASPPPGKSTSHVSTPDQAQLHMRFRLAVVIVTFRR